MLLVENLMSQNIYHANIRSTDRGWGRAQKNVYDKKKRNKIKKEREEMRTSDKEGMREKFEEEQNRKPMLFNLSGFF